MLKKTAYLLTAMIVLLVSSGCTTATTAPPEVALCMQATDTGIPRATLLLDPGQSPIEQITVRWDTSASDSNPSNLVKEDAITALNGQIWRRAEPVTPGEWWLPVPEQEWSTNALESLAALTLGWDLPDGLPADQKLVYQLQLRYLTPEGNALLMNSERQSISAGTGTFINADSEMCQDFHAFTIGG